MSREGCGFRVAARTTTVCFHRDVHVDPSPAANLDDVVYLNRREGVLGTLDRTIDSVALPEVAVVGFSTVSVDSEGIGVGLDRIAVILEGNFAGHIVPATLGYVERLVVLVEPHASHDIGRGSVTIPLGLVEIFITLPLKLCALYVSCRERLH